MRRSKFSFWLLSIALSFIASNTAALPIVLDADAKASDNYRFTANGACGARDNCFGVHFTPEIDVSIVVEQPLPTVTDDVVPILTLVDDAVPFVGGSGSVTPGDSPIDSSAAPVSVPEPGTLVLLAMGLFAFTMRRFGSS